MSGLFVLIIFFIYVSTVILTYLLNRDEIVKKIYRYKDWVNDEGYQEERASIKIYSDRNELIGNFIPVRGSSMNVKRCKALKWLKVATVAIEDQAFYKHRGVSIRSIARAIWHDLLALSLKEGGGTITQQLARTLFTGRKRSLYRKLYETLIALQMEDKLNKEEILCLYLDKIYMGAGRNGAEEASWFYFNKPPEALDVAEAAMIVGIFPKPTLYSPLNNIYLSQKKQRLVMEYLVKNKQITHKEKELSLRQFQKKYGVSPESSETGRIALYGASRDFKNNMAPTANDFVKNFIYKVIPEEVILRGDLKIFTTINLKRQQAALQIMRKYTENFRKSMFKRNSKADPDYLRSLVERLNGAFISIEASTGAILSIVGAFNLNENNSSQRIWNMLRQPGSSIKGFLYATALDENILNIHSSVIDAPSGVGYKPRNWNRKYLGEMPLAQAVAMSVNSVATNTLKQLGVEKFRSRIAEVIEMNSFELNKRIPSNLSIALGSAELTLLELAELYTAIANYGYVTTPSLILRIEDMQTNKTLWASPKHEKRGPYFSQEATAGALELMSHIFDSDFSGTVSYVGKMKNKNTSFLPFSIAGKTGTVQMQPSLRKRFKNIYGVRDIWFVGIVPDEVTVIWFGQDEGAPIVGSGASASKVWVEYAQTLRDKKDLYFIQPSEEGLQDANTSESQNSDTMSVKNNDTILEVNSVRGEEGSLR